MRILKSIITLSLFVLTLSIVGPVQAQQLTLSISPPLVETIIKPGKSILIGYTISNLGDPIIISPHVRPFAPQGIYGNLVLGEELEGPIRFNLDNSNIKLEDTFFLQSNEGQQLLLKIRVPEGTPEGDYYYTFYVENDLGKPIEGRDAARTQARVGTNILITVTESGQVDIGGSIGELSVIPRTTFSLFGTEMTFFESTDVIPVQLILQNTGRHLVKPEGDIVLSGSLGERAKFAVQPQNILSQSSRLVVATPSATLDPNNDKRIKPASMYLSGFFVGKYTLTADIDFGFGTEPHTASTTFYAFPFKLLIAAAIALGFGIILVKKLRQGEKNS